MSILYLAEPSGKPVDPADYKFELDEDRVFKPGVIHGGEYLIHVIAYEKEGETRMDVTYLDPYDIIETAENIEDEWERGKGDDFLPDMTTDDFVIRIAGDNLADMFVVANDGLDGEFEAINDSWDESVIMYPEDLIEWAKNIKNLPR